MIDLYKLEVFSRVVAAGSFSKAAPHLFMSQPAVSQHIHTLEQQLGATLLERSHQGVTLTAAGQTLLSYAEQILRLVAEAELAVTDVERLAGGQIAVGATPGVSAYLLPGWVERYRQRFPRLTVALQTGITSEIIGGVLGRSLALGIIEGEIEANDSRLGIRELEEVNQCVMVGPKHPWWERSHIALRDLDQQPMVMRQSGSQTRIWLDGALRQHGIQPHAIAELDNPESIKRLVMMGTAATILPGYAVQDEVSSGRMRAIPIDGTPLRRTLKLLWNRATLFSPVERSFIDHLGTIFPAAQIM